MAFTDNQCRKSDAARMLATPSDRNLMSLLVFICMYGQIPIKISSINGVYNIFGQLIDGPFAVCCLLNLLTFSSIIIFNREKQEHLPPLYNKYNLL